MTTHPDISRMEKFMILQHQGKFPWGRSKYKAELHRLLASPGLSEMIVEAQTTKTLKLDGKSVSTTELVKSPHSATLRSWWEEEATKAGTTLYPSFEFSDDDEVCEVVKRVPQQVMVVLDALQPPLLACKLMPSSKAVNEKIICGNHFKSDWGDTVPAKAFISRDDIEGVEIPYWINNVGYRAFYGCKNLKRVTFAPNLAAPKTMRTIHQDAFHMCVQLEDCVVPHGTKVEPNAFGHCINIKNGTVIRDTDFPKEWGTCVEKRAFSWRLDIVKVELPPHIRKIGEFAFQGCSNLVDCPIMPHTEIGRCAFHRCSKLPSFRCCQNGTCAGHQASVHGTSIDRRADTGSSEDDGLYD